MAEDTKPAKPEEKENVKHSAEPLSHALPSKHVSGADIEKPKPTKAEKPAPGHDGLLHGTHVETGTVKGTFIGFVRDEKSGEYDKNRALVLPYGAQSQSQAVEVPASDIKRKVASATAPEPVEIPAPGSVQPPPPEQTRFP